MATKGHDAALIASVLTLLHMHGWCAVLGTQHLEDTPWFLLLPFNVGL